VQPRNKVRFTIDMNLLCQRKCWQYSVKNKIREDYDPELECLECVLCDHIEGYPSKDFGEALGKLTIERTDLSGVDEN